MMALPDVYCLFNRARGTELISPDDLLQVAAQPQGLRVSISPHDALEGGSML